MTLTQTEPTPLGRSTAGGVHRLLIVHSSVAADVGYGRTLSSQPLELGRDPETRPGLVLRQAQVSRRHACIEASGEGQGFRIRDLGSRNGTFVNGRAIDSVELREGDVIRVGSTLILFQFLDRAACERVLEPLPRAGSEPAALARLVGHGHESLRVRDAIRSAPTSVPILILGETGVGKELVAEAIHEASGRPGAFVPVNCSALPSNLVESELFGHVRGAFTGAEARKGLFGRAERGTLFLDEIGEIAPDIQAKLLRALAIGEVRAVGSDQPRNVDVRVVAATNVDLESAVARGAFRADVFARLMSHIITVPPLRDRREDILELARHFLRDAGDFEITTDCAEALLVYFWPYNIRELEQLLAPLVPVVARRGTLELDDLPERLRTLLEARFTRAPVHELSSNPLLSVRRDAVPTADELRTVVEAHGGNIAQVASFFGKDRRQIYRWAQAMGLDLQSLREAHEPGQRTLPSPGSAAAAELSAAPLGARSLGLGRPRRDSDEIDPLAFD